MADGALYGVAGGVASTALMQGAWYYQMRTVQGIIGAESEFFVEEQTGNSKADTQLPDGAEPDLWGDALPWREPVHGDVKNTAAIPSMNAQPSVSGVGQLRQIYDAIPNRHHPQNNPNGNRMTLFYRPGAPTPKLPSHSMWSALSDGSLQLKPISQFVMAPWSAAVKSC